MLVGALPAAAVLAQGTTTTIAITGQKAPGAPAGAVFRSFDNPVINDAGQTAFRSLLRQGPVGVTSNNDDGIWRDSTLVAREGSQAGDTPRGAVFGGFGNYVLNDAGQTAYFGTLRRDSGGVDFNNDSGIWRDSTLVARKGSPAGGTPAGAVFRSIGNPLLNDAGQTAYFGTLRLNSGGVDSTNDNGIWITGTNGQSLLVAREGDSLAGRTIASVNLVGGSTTSGGSDGRRRASDYAMYKASVLQPAAGRVHLLPKWQSAIFKFRPAYGGKG